MNPTGLPELFNPTRDKNKRQICEKKMIAEKKILYDHSAKQEGDKYTGRQSLVKINDSFLPTYVRENLEKYKSWLD